MYTEILPQQSADPLAAYEALADAYDLLAADYSHDAWLRRIERIAFERGVRRGRVLDVACGTGRSFLPLLVRGWEVTACDLSPAMVERARLAAGDAADVFVADMRELDTLGEHELVTCLDDSVNYLLEQDEVVAAFEGFARNLAPSGVAVWDVNTLVMHRSSFATDWICEDDSTLIAWKGQTPPDLEARGIAQATIDVFARSGERYSRSRGVHRQRHWPAEDVLELAGAAGLRVLDVFGQRHGANLEQPPDELVHPKLLFVACRDS